MNPSGLRCRDWRGQWVEYQLVVENRGNQPAGIEIDGDFDAESLVVETPDGQVNLSLGSRKELAIRVRPARYNFFPAEQVYQFRLYASLENGDRADVPGQLSHPSFFSRNRKIGLVAVAVVLAALLFPSLGSQNPSGSYTSNTVNGKPLPSKTPTPTANSTGATRKDPVEVVRDFYDAVNDHQYERAWALIDDTKLGMSYEKFVRGFAHTDHVDAEISKTGPDTVRLRLIADEYGYSRKSVYGVSYRVHNGLIHSSTRQKKIR